MAAVAEAGERLSATNRAGEGKSLVRRHLHSWAHKVKAACREARVGKKTRYTNSAGCFPPTPSPKPAKRVRLQSWAHKLKTACRGAIGQGGDKYQG